MGFIMKFSGDRDSQSHFGAPPYQASSMQNNLNYSASHTISRKRSRAADGAQTIEEFGAAEMRVVSKSAQNNLAESWDIKKRRVMMSQRVSGRQAVNSMEEFTQTQLGT